MPNLDEHMAAEAVTRAKHPTSADEPPAAFRKKQALFFGLGFVALVVLGVLLSLGR